MPATVGELLNKMGIRAPLTPEERNTNLMTPENIVKDPASGMVRVQLETGNWLTLRAGHNQKK